VKQTNKNDSTLNVTVTMMNKMVSMLHSNYNVKAFINNSLVTNTDVSALLTPLDPNSRQLNPVHILKTYIFQVHFNIIIPSSY
jgi:hypothetical protein